MALSQWLAARAVGLRGAAARRLADLPAADLQPTVEWQVAGVCNYRCDYCIQSPSRRVGAPPRAVVERIIDGLGRLPGAWEIKMSGGEPFAFPGLMEWIVPALVERTPHRISVLTNFSASPGTLERFCVLTGSRLRITSASFHPDHALPDDFMVKALRYRELRELHNPNSSFVVNVVLVPGQIRRHTAISARLRAEGLRYFPQLMKIPGGVFPYSRKDLALIEALTGGSHEPREVNRAPSYQGLHCEAGHWYFVVDQRGEAYACRTGRRYCDDNEPVADDDARLGSLADGTFSRRSAGGPCPYPVCPCTVPANRNIVRAAARRGAP